MTKFMVAALAATAMSAFGAASAGATIVYEKQAGVFVTDDAGKSPRLLVPGGKEPAFSPDRRALIWKDAAGNLFSMPLTGGSAKQAIATGVTCPKVDSCIASFAPDSSALAIVDAKQNLHYAKMDGSAPLLLASGVESMATFSPDSQRIVYDNDPDGDGLATLTTIPIAGGYATALRPRFATLPTWTKAGIAATIFQPRGKSVDVRLVLMDDTGRITRTFSSKRVKDPDRVSTRGMEFPVAALPSALVSLELVKGVRGNLRVYAFNGKLKAKRPVKDLDRVQAVSANGKAMLITGRKGSLATVDIKTGKSRTLVRSGVKKAFTY